MINNQTERIAVKISQTVGIIAKRTLFFSLFISMIDLVYQGVTLEISHS